MYNPKTAFPKGCFFCIMYERLEKLKMLEKAEMFFTFYLKSRIT